MHPHHPHRITIFINKAKYELDDPRQTGQSLKHLAGVPLGDVLFRQRPHEDEVIGNDTTITVNNGDHFHSQPAADYGLGETAAIDVGVPSDRVALHAQPDGWRVLVITGYDLPSGYTPSTVRLLLKLPPLFPEAAPDMFWVSPSVQTAAGTLPRGTSLEPLLGENWQRFSWHLAPGAWKPGVSTLRDFMRCIRARFLRGD
jgi:hypothetical protein